MHVSIKHREDKIICKFKVVQEALKTLWGIMIMQCVHLCSVYPATESLIPNSAQSLHCSSPISLTCILLPTTVFEKSDSKA